MRETPKAEQAFNHYVALGAERSLEKLSLSLCARPEYAKSKPRTLRVLLKRWSSAHGWQARLVAIAEQERAAIIKRGVVERQNRVDALNDRWERMRRVIVAREREHPESDYAAAGVDSGLMVLTVKFMPGGGRSEEWAVDTGLLKELREHEKQAAIEVGQWAERKELTGVDGGPIEVTSARERIAGRIASLATRVGEAISPGGPDGEGS